MSDVKVEKVLEVHIKLAVDVGGSLTKCVYSYRLEYETEYKSKYYMLFEPYVEVVSSKRLDQYYQLKGSIGQPKPEDDAWLLINDEHIVVGSLAKEFDVEDRLRDLKYELAIYKVLAAVGMIATKHYGITLRLQHKSKRPVQITLAVLLPWNEYNDRSLFAQRLRKLGSSYRFQKDLNLSLEFKSLEVRPEGFGLFQGFYRNFRDTDKRRFVTEDSLGILMLGHRNVSGLYFEQGKLVKGDSPLLGFSSLCDRVVELSSRSNREEVALAINKTISQPKNFYSFVFCKRENFSSHWHLKKTYPKWEKMPLIIALSTAKDSGLRLAETKRIAEAIRQATEEYWERLQKWLKTIFPQGLKRVVISGGAQQFLEPKLEGYFNSIEVVQHYSEPKPEYVNDKEISCMPYKLYEGDTTIIYNNRIHSFKPYNELAEVLKLSQQSHLMYRLLDVYELHWKL